MDIYFYYSTSVPRTRIVRKSVGLSLSGSFDLRLNIVSAHGIAYWSIVVKSAGGQEQEVMGSCQGRRVKLLQRFSLSESDR